MHRIDHYFRKAADAIVDRLIYGAVTLDCRQAFNRIAKVKSGTDDYESGGPKWPAITLMPFGKLDDYQMYELTSAYQRAFVETLRVKKDVFLKNGNGITYINGILHSLSVKYERDDPITVITNSIRFGELAKGDVTIRSLGDLLLDFSDDAFCGVANQNNSKLASAYVLNMMEAFPVLKDYYKEDDNFTGRLRGILKRAMTSNLVEPELKAELKKNYDFFDGNKDYVPEAKPIGLFT